MQLATIRRSQFPAQSFPTARVNRALRLRNFRKTLFIALCVLFDSLFDLSKETAMKFFFRYPVAEKHHGICFSPILAVLPNLDWVATHLLRQLDQLRIVYVVTVTKKDLVVNRNQLDLEFVKRFWSSGNSHHVTELMGNFCCREHVAANQPGCFKRLQSVHHRIIDRSRKALIRAVSQRNCGGDQFTLLVPFVLSS